MPDDPEDDRSRKGRPPEVPAPHLRPRGRLRDMGDAYARKNRGVPSNQKDQPQTLAPPPSQMSEQDIVANGRRERLRHLQVQGLIVIRNEHQKKTEQSIEQFNEQHRDEIDALKTERQAIVDRGNGASLRGTLNRLSGRAAQDQDRLKHLDESQQKLDARLEEHLEPLIEEQREQLAGIAEIHGHERDLLELEIKGFIDPVHSHDRSNAKIQDEERGDNGGGRER